jgi:hypothetical protein
MMFRVAFSKGRTRNKLSLPWKGSGATVHLARPFFVLRKTDGGAAWTARSHFAASLRYPKWQPRDTLAGSRLKHGRNLFQQENHTDFRIDGGVDFVMIRSGMHHQNLGSLVSFFHHIGQVMAVILG